MKRSSIVIILALAAIIPVTGAKASPIDTPINGTANVANETHDVLSGQTATVDIGVKTTSVQPVNWIKIIPGDNIILGAGAQPNRRRTPTGWDAVAMSPDDGGVVFANGSAKPNEEVVFTLPVTIATVATDTPSLWTVLASSNSGATSKIMTPSAAGELSATIHVLDIVGLPTVSGPTAALATGKLTAGQANVAVTTTIKNYGSQAITTAVTNTIDKGEIVTAATPLSIPAGASRSFVALFRVSGDVADTPTVTSAAGSSDGHSVAVPDKTSATMTLQAPAALTCGASSPSAFSGGSAVPFSVSLAKTGDVGATTSAIVTGEVTASSPISLGSQPVVLPAGTPPDPINVSFAPAPIPAGTAEGDYALDLTVTGVDDNGAPFTTSVACPAVRLDRSVPQVTFQPLILPALAVVQSNPPLRQTAVKADDAINVAAHVLDGRAGACKIAVDSSYLRYVRADGTEVATDELTNVAIDATPGTCDVTATSKVLSPVPVGTSTVQAVLLVSDAAANSSGKIFSMPVAVKETLPTVTARTSGLDMITMSFTPCLAGGATPLDWTAVLHLVKSTTPTPCTDGSGLPIGGLTLTLADKLASRNDVPVLSYRQTIPDPGISALITAGIDAHYVDGAGHILAANPSIPTTDGLAPVAATLTDVSPGQSLYTNGGGDGRPTFTVAGPEAGDKVCVYKDGVSPGNLLGCANGLSVRTSAEAAFAPSAPDRDIPIIVTVEDSSASHNSSTSSPAPIHFDRTKPVLQTAAITANTSPSAALLGPDAMVRVAFNESIATGADSAADWVLQNPNGKPVSGVAVSSVGQCAPAVDTCRVLSIDAGGSTLWQNITRAKYAPGVTSTPYKDKATNTVANIPVAVTQG